MYSGLFFSILTRPLYQQEYEHDIWVLVRYLSCRHLIYSVSLNLQTADLIKNKAFSLTQSLTPYGHLNLVLIAYLQKPPFNADTYIPSRTRSKFWSCRSVLFVYESNKEWLVGYLLQLARAFVAWKCKKYHNLMCWLTDLLLGFWEGKQMDSEHLLQNDCFEKLISNIPYIIP